MSAAIVRCAGYAGWVTKAHIGAVTRSEVEPNRENQTIAEHEPNQNLLFLFGRTSNLKAQLRGTP